MDWYEIYDKIYNRKYDHPYDLVEVLNEAAIDGNSDMVKILILAEVDSIDDSDAIQQASFNGHAEVVSSLLGCQPGQPWLLR